MPRHWTGRERDFTPVLCILVFFSLLAICSSLFVMPEAGLDPAPELSFKAL